MDSLTPSQPMPTLPSTHALLIGIADYQQVNRLPQQVRNDVQDVHIVLMDPQQERNGCAFF